MNMMCRCIDHVICQSSIPIGLILNLNYCQFKMQSRHVLLQLYKLFTRTKVDKINQTNSKCSLFTDAIPRWDIHRQFPLMNHPFTKNWCSNKSVSLEEVKYTNKLQKAVLPIQRELFYSLLKKIRVIQYSP